MDGIHGQGNQDQASLRKLVEPSTSRAVPAGARRNSNVAAEGRGNCAVRALAAYKDFLTLWKDAEPDIPVLKEAKAEYAKLQ